MSFPIGPFRRFGGKPGGAVLPSRLPLLFSHLEEYYDSRTPVLVNGANVTSWADLSGNSRTMIDPGGGVTLPTMLTAGSPKSTNLIRFSGAGGGSVALTTGTFTLPVATRGFTYYAYGDWRSSAPGSGEIWTTSAFNSTPRELLFRTNTGLMGWRDNGGFHLPVAPSFGVHQYAFVFNPPGNGTGIVQVYKDAVLIATDTWQVNGVANDTTLLGNTVNFNVGLNADLGHFVWYSDVHTATQVALFKIWASIYWGF